MMRSRSLRWLISLAAVVLLLAGCADTDDAAADTTLAPATTVSETTTTTQVPSTTSTSVMVTPTLPPALDAKYPVVLTEGVTGPDTMDIAVWAPEAMP
jgi:hypothetical protein